MEQSIVLYDGVCGLCNRLVQFLIARDTHDRLRFAALQSDFAATVLQRHGIDPRDLDTVQLIEHYDEANERVFGRSDAVAHALIELGGFWEILGRIGTVVPAFIRDLVYRLVARTRYQIFGKSETCMIPDPTSRSKFLDLQA